MIAANKTPVIKLEPEATRAIRLMLDAPSDDPSFKFVAAPGWYL